jgi:hypothetical protein
MKAEYTDRPEVRSKTSFAINIPITKKKREDVKINLFWRWVPVGGYRHKER